MKHLSLTIFLSLLVLSCFGQRSSGIVVSQGVTNTTPNSPNFVWVDTTATGLYNWKLARKDSIQWKPWNVTWLNDSVISIGNLRYVRIAGSYTDPSFIQSLSSSKVFGLSPVALSGNYSDLSGLPNLANYYPISNPAGYISGITGSMVTGALGYVPYDASSNPNNYQTKSVQAANGLIKSSSLVADTIETDWNLVMSVQRATDSINSIKSILNTKLNITDTANKWLGVGYSPSNSQVISALGGTPLFSEVDGSTTNELQTLSIVNRIITLSNAGGTVTIPYQSYDSLTNKPTIPTNTNQLTNGSGFINQAQARTAISLTTSGSGAATYNSSTGVLNIPTPTASKRQETYSGNTNASGEYTITFGTAFSAAPNIQASITNQTNPQQFIMVTAVSTTGCTIKVVQRNASFLSLLGLDVLTTGVTNVNNAPVDVLVTSK